MPITTDKRNTIGIDPVMVDWSKFEKNPKLNPKDIPIGSVVYYVRKSHNKYSVDYGIVYDHYSDCVMIQRVCLRDRRMIKSAWSDKPVKWKDFPYHTDWYKLPKGWTWNTELYEICSEPMSEEEEAFQRLRIDQPENIIEGYNKGYLVNVRDVPYEKIEVVIEKSNGYKLTRQSMGSQRIYDGYRPVDTVGVSPFQCFSTYAEAKASCEKAEAELLAQSEMTDYEWSVKLIKDDIDRWAGWYGISNENKARATDFLMSLDDLEDIETKVESGTIQFRKYGKKKWNALPIE